MRDYAKVSPQFWTGETGRALKAHSPEALIVAMYLMTCPSANMIGLYYLPILYIGHETGLGVEGARKGLQGASEAGFCTYDEASEHVFVHAMVRFQVGDQLSPKDNRCKGVANELERAPKGALRRRFLEMYASAFHLDFEPDPEAPCKGLASQEQEQEQEQEKEQKPSGAEPPESFEPDGETCDPPADPTSKPVPIRQRGCTFAAFVDECRAKGEKPIPEGHPVFRFADDAGIPVEFVRLAWFEFRRDFGDGGKSAKKRQAGVRGWRQHFDNAVRKGWYRLWAFDRQGECYLTPAGIALQREAEARDAA